MEKQRFSPSSAFKIKCEAIERRSCHTIAVTLSLATSTCPQLRSERFQNYEAIFLTEVWLQLDRNAFWADVLFRAVFDSS